MHLTSPVLPPILPIAGIKVWIKVLSSVPRLPDGGGQEWGPLLGKGVLLREDFRMRCGPKKKKRNPVPRMGAVGFQHLCKPFPQRASPATHGHTASHGGVQSQGPQVLLEGSILNHTNIGSCEESWTESLLFGGENGLAPTLWDQLASLLANKTATSGIPLGHHS